MKTCTWHIIVFFIFATQAIAADSPIKWAFDPWAPLHQQDRAGKTEGLLVDIIKAVLTDEMGIQVEYNQLPWNRCQALVKNGVLDLLVTVATKERLEYAVKSKKAVYLLKNKIYTYVNHPRLEEIKKIKTLEDIIKGKFKVISYLGNGWFKQTTEKTAVDAIYVRDYNSVLRKLAQRGGDITIDSEPSTNSYIHKLGLNDRIVNTQADIGVLGFTKLHLLISKKSSHAGIMQRFDDAFEKLEKNGTLKLLIHNHAKKFK